MCRQSTKTIRQSIAVCVNVIDKSKDVSRMLTLEDGTSKEYRLRKCTFCLDAQRPSLFERDAVSSSFILKRGTQFMKDMACQKEILY